MRAVLDFIAAALLLLAALAAWFGFPILGLIQAWHASPRQALILAGVLAAAFVVGLAAGSDSR